ncbi:MAG: Maf family protein [Pirellulaceae bacterium]
MFHHRIILGSQSPRRRELLARAGFEFDVMSADPSVEGGLCSGCSPDELVVRWAVNKAGDIAKQMKASSLNSHSKTESADSANSRETLIITADTVAEVDGQILGKPRDEDDARRMLQMMSGRSHRCLTGVCLWDAATSDHVGRLAISDLYMHPLSESQITAYLQTDKWIGKSGAFGFQDGPDWLELRTGLASTVIGLPVELLPEWIKEFYDIER